MSDDVDATRVTRADLHAGFKVAIGRPTRLQVVADHVEIEVEWPAHVVDRLPDDFQLILSGSGIPKQTLGKSSTVCEDDLARFAFSWDGPASAVTLEASANGKTVVLWRGHDSSNLSTPVAWSERLDPLLVEHEEVEIAGRSTGAGSVPADLGIADLDALIAGLF
jgi:hypothetical protein